jgi:membrane protein implicated in regulation of membrane protease activity
VFVIEPWHWLVLAMLLMVAEIVIPSFTIFWFGLGGLIVSALLWIFPDLGLNVQLLIWAISSIVFTALWFLLIGPLIKDKTKAGMAKEAIAGEVGQVIKRPSGQNRGVVRFTTPLLGDDEWEFICQDAVGLGDRVAVVELSGNTLVVTKR